METQLDWTCSRCHGIYPAAAHGAITSGYGLDAQDNKVCYSCCADEDKAYMVEHGRITLYLDDKERKVTNWPGSLVFPVVAQWKGNHNWWCVGNVTFARFIGPDGKVWSGRCVGDMTQLFHCRATKIDPSQARYR